MNRLIKIVLAAVLLALAVWLLTSNSASNNKPTTQTPDSLAPASNAYKDLIIVENPKPQDAVSSPLNFSGQARGNWYFEATFPVRLIDRDGTELGVGYAQASSDWMTTEYVPFSGQLNFRRPATSNEAFLVFQKSNASGLPENDDQYQITVTFPQ